MTLMEEEIRHAHGIQSEAEYRRIVKLAREERTEEGNDQTEDSPAQGSLIDRAMDEPMSEVLERPSGVNGFAETTYDLGMQLAEAGR